MTWLYDNLETLDYSKIDEPIRELVKMINESEWMRTEESCCGHPAYEPSGWAGSELYLRLVVLKAEKNWNLFASVEQLRKSFGKSYEYHISLLFDRQDALGQHWFFKVSYHVPENRSIAIDATSRAISMFLL